MRARGQKHPILTWTDAARTCRRELQRLQAARDRDPEVHLPAGQKPLNMQPQLPQNGFDKSIFIRYNSPVTVQKT